MLKVFKEFLPNRWHRAIVLFFASLLISVSIASCSGSSTSATKMAVINTAEVVPPKGIPGQTLAKIMAARTVRVAVPDDFPPFGSMSPKMTLRGYDIDVATEIAKGLKVKLELIPVIGNYRVPFLQTDRADLVISSLGKNKDRAKIIDFSQPYAPFFSGVYGLPDQPR